MKKNCCMTNPSQKSKVPNTKKGRKHGYTEGKWREYCTDTVKEFCQLNIGSYPHAVYGALFLDSRNRLIQFKDLFKGALNRSTVYPRKIVAEAIALEASSVVITRNHPTGDVTPSKEDLRLTRKIHTLLFILDIKLIDHIIVSADESFSFFEEGIQIATEQ